MGSAQPPDFDPHKFTRPFQLTKTIHRDPYFAISTDNPANSKKGQIIVITGGGTGIGAAAAEVWCRAGALGVVISGRRVDRLDAVVQHLRKKYHNTKILAVRADVTVANDMEFLFSNVRSAFGRAADVVLANAGIMEKHNLIADQDVDAWWNSMARNLLWEQEVGY